MIKGSNSKDMCMISMSLFSGRKYLKYYCHLHVTKQFDLYKVYIKWGIVGSDAGKLKPVLIFPHLLSLHYLLVLQNSYLQKVLWKFANPCICLLPDNLPLTLAVKNSSLFLLQICMEYKSGNICGSVASNGCQPLHINYCYSLFIWI